MPSCRARAAWRPGRAPRQRCLRRLRHRGGLRPLRADGRLLHRAGAVERAATACAGRRRRTARTPSPARRPARARRRRRARYAARRAESGARQHGRCTPWPLPPITCTSGPPAGSACASTLQSCASSNSKRRHRRLRRRQRGKLAFDVHEARHVAHRLAVRLVEHRQPVRQHHGEPAVVVAVRELGVVDVDLAHVGEQRQVLLAREDLLQHRFGHGEVQALLDVLVVGVEQRACRASRSRRPASRVDSSASPSATTTSASHGTGDGVGAAGGVALPRQACGA